VRLIYGVNPVLEALRARGREVQRVLVERSRDGRRPPAAERVAQAARQAGASVVEVETAELQRRTHDGVHQGVACELPDLPHVEMEDLLELARQKGEPALLLLLDGVTDPQNFGALVRSAYALGANGVVIPKDRAVGVTPASVKASAGALEHCPVARVTNLSRAVEQLKGAGIWTVALAGEGEESLADLDLRSPTALVLGSEGSGVRQLVRRTCDHVARIPMPGGFGSLNVAAAGAIALYEVTRQRQRRGRSGNPAGKDPA
jgi:23S rRNA (guanosine2251-2'-O)-methyltransferase